MPKTIKFLLDEQVDIAIALGLRQRGVDVLSVQEAGRAGASDDSHLIYAAQVGRVLFTQDTDFLRIHPSGVHHRGIVFGEQANTIGRILNALMLLYEIYDPEDMLNRVEYLP